MTVYSYSLVYFIALTLPKYYYQPVNKHMKKSTKKITTEQKALILSRITSPYKLAKDIGMHRKTVYDFLNGEAVSSGRAAREDP